MQSQNGHVSLDVSPCWWKYMFIDDVDFEFVVNDYLRDVMPIDLEVDDWWLLIQMRGLEIKLTKVANDWMGGDGGMAL